MAIVEVQNNEGFDKGWMAGANDDVRQSPIDNKPPVEEQPPVVEEKKEEEQENKGETPVGKDDKEDYEKTSYNFDEPMEKKVHKVTSLEGRYKWSDAERVKHKAKAESAEAENRRLREEIESLRAGTRKESKDKGKEAEKAIDIDELEMKQHMLLRQAYDAFTTEEEAKELIAQATAVRRQIRAEE